MAKAVRGYSSYRGRGPFWKVAAAVVLVAVILASFGVLMVQRNMVRDPDSGNVRLEFPWQREQNGGGEEPDSQSGEPETVPITEADPTSTPVPEPETPPFRAVELDASPFTEDAYWQALDVAAEGEYNAVSVTLKNEDGLVFFSAPSAIPGLTRTERGTGDALRLLTGSELHTIARLSCFLDPLGANSNVRRYGLRNTGGYLFFDGNDQNWMDPSKDGAIEYLCGLATDAAELGFDEILLTNACYPTVGKIDKIAYGENNTWDNLIHFLSEMHGALESYGVSLSVEVPKAVLDGEWDGSGLNLGVVTPWVDRVYARVEPGEIAGCLSALAEYRGGAVEFIAELDTLPGTPPKRFLFFPS